MTINLRTIAEGCHINVSIKIQNHTLITLTDNDQGSLNLLPGITYRFEWFVFSAKDNAHARIQAAMATPNSGFPLLNIDKHYSAGEQDGNVFLFTLN